MAKTNQSKKTEIKAEMKEKLTLLIFELQMQKNGKATIDDITQELLNEKIKEYQCKVINDETIEGKKIKMTKDRIAGMYIIDLGLKIEEVKNAVEIYYEIVEVLENKVKILIHARNEVEGLAQIEFPDIEAIIFENNKTEEKEIQYEIEFDKEYTIKIKSEDGSEKELKIIEYKIEKPIIKADTAWTNEDLTVEVDFGGTSESIKKQISIDGGITYSTYTDPVKVEKNTIIKARAIGVGLQEESELEIKNIDKLEPKDFTPTIGSDIISSTELTIKASTTDMEATDEYGISGIKQYQYYVYEGETLIVSSGKITNTSWNATSLTAGKKYNIYVEAYDNAGNIKKSKDINYTKLGVYVWEKYSASEELDKYKLNVASTTTTIVRDGGNSSEANLAYFYKYHFSESTGITRYSSQTVKYSSFSTNDIYYYQQKYYRYSSFTSTTFPYLYKWTGYLCSAEPVYKKVKGTTSYGTVKSNNSGAYPSNGYQSGYWYVKK